MFIVSRLSSIMLFIEGVGLIAIHFFLLALAGYCYYYPDKLVNPLILLALRERGLISS